MSAGDYRTQTCRDLAEVDPAEWDALVDPREPGAVFVRHAWLAALEATGCVGRGTGWMPAHLLLRADDGRLVAAAPRYRKLHSFGEYVFDWAWADAFERHGLAYYPKWLVAVPFTPVEGPRLLARDAAAREALATALVAEAMASGLSSLHVLFPPSREAALLGRAGLMERHGVQFRWTNRGYRDFDEFLAQLTQPKRKKIRAERRRVAQAGVETERLAGAAITPAHWRLFEACYRNTYFEHGSSPYLSLEFFERIGREMPEACVLNIASRGGRPIAASLLVRDEDRLYGRYWGALERVDCLHFELAYYQSIEAAIALGITHVEGGAQGEHKLARGFEAVRTASCHWIAEPAFADAVDAYLRREDAMIDGYLGELHERAPFRAGVGRGRDLRRRA
jgi:predicted N-acyltransferase